MGGLKFTIQTGSKRLVWVGLAWLVLVAVLPAESITVHLKQPHSAANHRKGIICDLIKVAGTSTQVVQTTHAALGRASFSELDPGIYQLRAHRRDDDILSSNIVVAANETTVVDFEVPAPKQPVVETFRSQTELSSVRIRQLAESQDGTLWAISHNGLMAFIDGWWKPHSLVGVKVYEVAACGEDMIAFSQRGIYKVSRNDPPVRISPAEEDFKGGARYRLGARDDGAILFSVGTNLVFQQEDQRRHLTLPEPPVRILACPDRSFIILTHHAIWQWREEQEAAEKVLEDPELNFRSLVHDAEGGCLVYARGSTEDVLLSIKNGTCREHQRIPKQNRIGPWGLSESKGTLWVSGMNSLTRIEQGRIVEISLPVGEGFGAAKNQHKMTVLARTNDVWAGGLHRIHRIHDEQKYVHRAQTGLVGQRPRSLAKDAQGRLWAVSHDTVNVYEHGEWRKFSTIPKTDPHYYIRHRPMVQCLSNRVFIATWKGLFAVEGGRLGQSGIPQALRGSPIGHLGPAAGGISANSGNKLFRFDAERSSWQAELEVPEDLMPAVVHMWVDPQNKVWASDGRRTACLEQGRWRIQQPEGLTSGELRFPPFYASDGTTFASVEDNCLRITNQEARPFFQQAIAAYNFRESDIGQLVSTSSGLFILRNNRRWKLGPSEGLPSVIVYDAIHDQDRLWVCTAQGLVEIHHALKPPSPPRVKIITGAPQSTTPVRFMVESDKENATVASFAGVHHSSPPPLFRDQKMWQRVPQGGTAQYLSSRPGKHRLYAYTENAFGQRSPVTEQPLQLAQAQIQFARRVRNVIIIGLGLILVALTAWGWWRQRNLLEREAAARKAAEAAAEEARQANLAKSRFLANVSHELRTPLTSVIGYGDLIAMDEDTPETMRDSALAIQRGGGHLLSVVNNVITLSQIESGGALIATEPTSLESLLQDVHGQLKFLAAKKDLAFEIEPAPNLPRLVSVDPGKLRQILLNLVANAIKFTEKGHVTLRCRTERERIWFDVEDSGPGISEELRKDLFSPFARGREHTKIEGAGLGLALSKTIAETMGGDISVESTPGTGSTFRLWIPLVAATLEPEAIEPEASTVVPAGEICGSILIVDDEIPNRKLFTKMIRGMNLDVRTAEDGRSAVEMSRDWRPDLILMDLRLPDISGEQAAHLVLEQWVEDPPWITCISADVFGIDRESESSPFDDYLNKPIRKVALTTHIQKVLSRQKNTPEKPADPT